MNRRTAPMAEMIAPRVSRTCVLLNPIEVTTSWEANFYGHDELSSRAYVQAAWFAAAMSRSRCLCFLWAIPRVLALSKGYSLGLGVDLGTSGVRACVVSLTPGQPARVVGEAKTGWSDEDGRLPEIWLSALKETLAKCERASEAQRICVSGTSAYVIVVMHSSSFVAGRF